MKNLLTYIILLVILTIVVLAIKFMANEPILPTIEKVDFTPEYQFDNFGKG